MIFCFAMQMEDQIGDLLDCFIYTSTKISYKTQKKIYKFFFRLSVALVHSPYYPDDLYFVNVLFSFILCNFNPVQTRGGGGGAYEALQNFKVE